MKTINSKALALLFSFTAIILAIPDSAYSQNDALQGPITVSQAVDYAIKNHTDIKNAVLEVDIAKAKMNELIGVGLPQINVSADVNKYIELPTQFIPAEFFDGEPGTYAPVQFGQDYGSTAGLTASQLVFDGSYLIGLKATKVYGELSVKNLSLTKIDVAANVTKAYYLVLVAEEKLKQLDSDLERLDKLRSDTKAMYENGFVEKIDYDRIELNYNLVESASNQTRRFVENSYNVLKFQMGMDLKTPLQLAEKISDISFDASSISADTVDVNQRVEYSILKTRYELTALDVRRYKSLRYPNLVLFGSLNTTASRDEFNFFDTQYKWYPSSMVGVSLSMPIFGGFKIKEQVNQAKLRNKQVENGFFKLEQGIKLEQQTSATQLNNNIDKLKTQSKNRDLAREISRVSKIKYDQGVGSNLEVIDAESSLREAEANYYTALLETIISKIDLDKATGKIKY